MAAMCRNSVCSGLNRGVPAMAAVPSRAGFGRALIEEALPCRLGAETRLHFRPGGVCRFIRMPLHEELTV